jgi:hypothetical protein
VRVPALAVVAALAAGCGGGSQAVRSGEAGVTVELPAGWHATPGGPVGNVIDPVARVVVSSSEIVPEVSGCQTSSYAFAADAVALVLVEWRDPSVHAKPRPPRFTPAGLRIARGSHVCFRGRFGSAFFADAGRPFGAYVFIGDQAPAHLVDQVCEVLDSLVVEPRSRARAG